LKIVIRGNYAKSTQSPRLKRALLDTGNRTLAEASPFDLNWGIGIRADNPLAQDPDHWRGKNLLGEALMQVRMTIRVEDGIA
jgi:ribA/ribD-fused uncharacterized protein